MQRPPGFPAEGFRNVEVFAAQLPARQRPWHGPFDGLPGFGRRQHHDVVPGAREEHRPVPAHGVRSEEHTSELQSLMRISYAVFCLKKKKTHNNETTAAAI